MSDDILKNGTTYTFREAGEPIPLGTRIKTKIWQIGPSSVASLMCLPYGIMLGWASPTYPKLLPQFSPDTPINITCDHTALIAGLLMIGNSLGTPFSTISILGTKYGISLGLTCMLAGWIVMRFASGLYYLLASRLLIGLGFGYGVGQLKIYVSNISQPPLTSILTKLIPFYVFFGIIIAYVLGYFTSFTDFSTVITILTSVIISLCLILPHTPKEYLLAGKERQAKTVIRQITAQGDVEYEVMKLNAALEVRPENMSLLEVCKNRRTAKYAAIISLLTFLQQFTGAPATIVYAHIIFMESNSPYPEICAIAYSMMFFVSNFIGTFYMDSFNKKSCLLFSSVSVILALALNITVFYFNLNETYWSFTSLITMFLYIFVHSTGLAVVPFSLTHAYLPPKAVRVVTKLQIVQHSILALFITKICQELYDRFAMYVSFCFFISVALLSLVLIWLVLPNDPPVLDGSIKPVPKQNNC